MNDVMIEVDQVTRKFGSVRALDGVCMSVERGSVLGLLGHNGAGKTTLINILATLLPLTGGRASVAGFDVAHQGDQVRRRIGLTGQYASVDEQLSGRANLRLIARLLGAGRAQTTARADELLEVFDLADAANRPVRTYSGGMRRRLDLAASLVGTPDVIFLDEPTTGLDPTSRDGLWHMVEQLVADGATVLLTTQYLAEADRLADRISLLSQGKLVASGTAAELKAQVGRPVVRVAVAEGDHARRATSALRRAQFPPLGDPAGTEVEVPVESSREFAGVVRALDEADVELTGLAFAEPTLEDVYRRLAAGTAPQA